MFSPNAEYRLRVEIGGFAGAIAGEDISLGPCARLLKLPALVAQDAFADGQVAYGSDGAELAAAAIHGIAEAGGAAGAPGAATGHHSGEHWGCQKASGH